MTARASGRLVPVAVLALGLAACGGGGGGGTPTAQHTLAVLKGGAGTGMVAGGAISCGATCSVSLPYGTAVALTASPAAGSTFGGWTGCDATSPDGLTCNLTMTADRTVTATFGQSPGQSPGSLQVVNSTSYTIAELYVSPAGAGTWGSNQLAPPSSPIAPSGTFTLTNIPVGSHDFLAVASDGYSYWLTTLSITDGGVATWTLMPPLTGSLSVTNFHCVAVTGLYLRPSSAPNPSPNQLITPIDPTVTFTLAGIPVGTYDVSAVGIDGTTWAINGVAITVGGIYPWSLFMPAGTGCLTVINDTADHTINFLFDPPSPSGCTNNLWGNEQLQGTTIPPIPAPGSSFTLTNVPAGPHDLRALGTSPLGAVEHRKCAMSIVAGGTFLWYLSL